MKNNNLLKTIFVLIICLILIGFSTSCNTDSNDIPTDTDTFDSSETETPSTYEPADTLPDTPTVTPLPSLPPDPEIVLVPYDGVVEHIFFHEVIAYPELAFYGSGNTQGYANFMVTASEYIKILESLYKNDFILVNMNDVWSEYTDDNGIVQMQRNILMLPYGKKPIIISFDDINFYEYMKNDGFMEKLIIGEDGEIWAQGIDPYGNTVITQDLAVVPILDKFIKENPDFSLNGAKGCIALTGYEGILGYRTQYDRNDNTVDAELYRLQEIARVRPVIDRLKETGWYFATHSYGHIDIANSSLNRVITDADRWMDEVGVLIGETQIFIYPFGSRLDGNDVDNTGSAFKYYHDLGFRLFASVGYEPFTYIKPDISAVVCDRMNVDGIAFRTGHDQYSRFYDVSEVRDPMRPA